MTKEKFPISAEGVAASRVAAVEEIEELIAYGRAAWKYDDSTLDFHHWMEKRHPVMVKRICWLRNFIEILDTQLPKDGI